ncbi:MAG: diaminobutyrate--2-oxoglutarate transaminase [Eubacteriaceae bacterium]|nr:diaminobutyrate--2-oxoglutarate transaminase [Eubacteriaceae bacterium]
MEKKELFETYESEVRSYCRNLPAVFTTAKGSKMYDDAGVEYLDFFDGAGALNYGHNNDYIKGKVLEYLAADGITHALDLMTEAKAGFIDVLENKLLKPKNLDYKVQFTGPTGTNANEAAAKLARKVTGRTNIWAFMGSFHGMTAGSLALTSQKADRAGAGMPLSGATFIPSPYMLGGNFDSIGYMEMLMADDHSGADTPAAIFIETVQAEGGIYVFAEQFLRDLRAFCDKYGILLVVDDIQVGNARTGKFFSFERAGIVPDMVTLSKSIGGMGLPLALVLLKGELDIWKPGEHNGTFRGMQLSLVAGKAGIEYMLENDIEAEVERKGLLAQEYIASEIAPLSHVVEVRGLGLVRAIQMESPVQTAFIQKYNFEHQLISERCGRDSSATKIMPALTISDDELLKGLEIIKNAIKSL